MLLTAEFWKNNTMKDVDRGLRLFIGFIVEERERTDEEQKHCVDNVHCIP